MTVVQRIGRPINHALGKIGYRITALPVPTANDQKSAEYLNAIKELEGAYRELLFKDLPENDERTRLMSELIGTGLSEALYLLNYLNKALKLEGDVCEFGVAQGATSALMANEIEGTDKNLWLFDSFQGLPGPSKKDVLLDDIFGLGSIEAYEGTMACGTGMVIGRLRRIGFPDSRTRIVPGFIEETIKNPDLPGRVCFAYVDFDFYEPIIAALKFLDKVLPAGGFVMVDDYGFFSAGAKEAVDEFVDANKDRYRMIFPIKASGHFCILEKAN